MPSLPHPREGTPIKLGNVIVPFVLYSPALPEPDPTRILASSPWKCIEHELLRQKSTAETACSFVHLAHDFSRAADIAGPVLRPVLLYYSFLNLGKAIILHKNPGKNLTRALHGLTESQANVRKRFTLTSQRVSVRRAQGNRPAVLGELVQALGYQRLKAGSEWWVSDLLAQLPAIHRSYCTTRGETERLFAISHAEFLSNHQTREVWAFIRVKRSEFPTRDITRQLMRRRYFELERVESGREFKAFYSFQTREFSYRRSPLESLGRLCRELRDVGVVPIVTSAGYRYYLSNFEPGKRLPPLIAAYMAIFYFGFVARYRPRDLEKMRSKEYAWAIDEMLATQGEQFVYLAASELLEREVARPWAVRTESPFRS